MEPIDIVILVANVIITVVSLVGACKSVKYYKKSKSLTAHTNISKALLEIEKMLSKLPEALSCTNTSRRVKGFNLSKTICDIGNDLSNSYNIVHSCVPSDYSSEFFALEVENCFELRKYINRFIDGNAIQNDTLNSDDYAMCQKRLMTMQEHLKKKQDEIGEKLK